MKLTCILFLCLFAFYIPAQELFPFNDPASNIGKNVLSVKMASETFDELGQQRNAQSLRFMFGLSSKWMLSETFSFSNHHGYLLPGDFIQHDSLKGNFTDGEKKGKYFPYRFESLNINLKYRFLAHDADQRHFRMAAYLDLSGGNEAHYEAEPNLIGDNGGAGLGIIATWLIHRLAVSINTGGILPSPYLEPTTQIRMDYGKALYANLSVGYLLYPAVYKNYRQLNINLYSEFQCKTYGSASITENGYPVTIIQAPTLAAGSYIEWRPSIQFIIHSNTRIDASLATPLYNRSWVHNYPLYYITVTQNIFFRGESG
jgi:hypothetical protein